MLVGAVAPTSEVLYTVNLGKGLVAYGHSVTVYTRDAKAVDTMMQEAGIGIRHLPFTPLYTLHAARGLARDLRQEADKCVIICQSMQLLAVAAMACRLAGRRDFRRVLVQHKMRRPRVNPLARIIISSANVMIFSSESARRLFRKSWRKTPLAAYKMHVVHNSVNIDADSRTISRKGPAIALYKGTISPGRGLETLLEAMTALRGHRVRLVIIGKGNSDYIDFLRRMAINIGIMDLIAWKINPSTAEQLAIMQKADFGVFPYGSDDAFGFPNIEIMALAMPQIITATPVAAEYIGPRGGAIYVPADDPTALAEAMRTLASDSEIMARCGESARARFNTVCPYDGFISRTISAITH